MQIDIAGVRCGPISRYQAFHGWDRGTKTVKETQLQKGYPVYNPTVYISGYLPFHTCTPLICKASLPKVWIQMDGWAQVSSHATRGCKKIPNISAQDIRVYVNAEQRKCQMQSKFHVCWSSMCLTSMSGIYVYTCTPPVAAIDTMKHGFYWGTLHIQTVSVYIPIFPFTSISTYIRVCLLALPSKTNVLTLSEGRQRQNQFINPFSLPVLCL